MSKKQKSDSVPGKINFHYLKSPYFRVIRVNGVWGGVTPQNEVQVSIYSERYPIPDSVTHQVNSTDGLGKEISRKMKDGLVREVEAVLSIDPKVAKALGIWLLQQAEESDKYNQVEVDNSENIQPVEDSDTHH